MESIIKDDVNDFGKNFNKILTYGTMLYAKHYLNHII